jgi:acyl-CoA synthetase (AMP-forming)/AMP-acid ligase II
MTGPTLLHHLLDRTAADAPERPAVGLGPNAVTYAWVRERSRRLAGWLSAAGVRRGDRVVIALPPDVLVPALLFACSRVGAAFVVVGDSLPEVMLEHVLDDAEPALLLADVPELQGRARRRSIPHRGLDDARRAAEQQQAAAPSGPLAVDPVCFIYTSGSTGMPKAVVSTHAQAVFAAMAIQSQLAYRPDDVVFCPLPLSFDYGLYQAFLCTVAGARLQLAAADEAGLRLLAQLNAVEATVLPAVPALAGSLARLLARPGAVPPPLRLLTNTGAAMPDSILAELRARIPGLRVQLMFGLTECKRATIMPPDEDLRRPGACGRALPGTEVFATDQHGDRLPPGQVGELVVRGPHVMAGYWRRSDLTAERFPRSAGLFPELRTGDYGRLDEDGYLYWEGRRDDLYKERGFRVSVAEVETAAHRVPGVEAAGVLPPASGRDGATLFVVGELAPYDVLRELRGQLDGAKVPARCVVVPELPLNRNGKVDRRALGELLAGVSDG